MPNRMYESVSSRRVERSAFDLSYEKKLTGDMGQLIPVMCEEVVPGDIWKIGVEAVIRFMPMVAPVIHAIQAHFHFYFVPNRLLETVWEDFITGGVNGTDASSLATWIPTGGNVTNGDGTVVADNGVGSLWDYMGFPVGVIPAGAYPLSLPRAAYNQIWNDWFRDQQQQAKIALTSAIVHQRTWEKDYFTSALPWQQRGTAPAIPLSGSGQALWVTADSFQQTAVINAVGVTTVPDSRIQVNQAQGLANLENALEENAVSYSTAGTWSIADFRLQTSIQRWMEANARGGSRYVEWLKNHFSISPTDDRLDRAEYIGGTRMPVMVSDVEQTSKTEVGAPQGNLAGKGTIAGRDFCASYKAPEFGVIMGIMSIMPEPVYHQGINKQWLRTTRYDFYSPEWANLSEQPVLRREIYADGNSGNNNTVFGYQGRFNEMRSKQNMLCGLMREGVAGSLHHWHLGRHFAAAPSLNATFMTCIPKKSFLAVPAQPTFLASIRNVIKAIRPMPIEPIPGEVK